LNLQILEDSRQAEYLFKISVAMVFDFAGETTQAKHLLGDLASLTHLERTNKLKASEFWPNTSAASAAPTIR
jgi:hypothetical protein